LEACTLRHIKFVFKCINALYLRGLLAADSHLSDGDMGVDDHLLVIGHCGCCANTSGEPEITRVVLWPAWLVAEHKVPDVAQDVERDTGAGADASSSSSAATAEKDQDAGQSEEARRRRRALRRQLRDKKRGLRTVCCYGDGRFMKV